MTAQSLPGIGHGRKSCVTDAPGILLLAVGVVSETPPLSVNVVGCGFGCGDGELGVVEFDEPHDDTRTANVITIARRIVEGETGIVHPQARRLACDAQTRGSAGSKNGPRLMAKLGRTNLASAHFGKERIVDIPAISASEDFGSFGSEWHVPSVFWTVGGTDPDIYRQAKDAGRLSELPTNHNPRFAPAIHTTAPAASPTRPCG